MPEVTILTAVRNGARYLPATIESVLAQTFADWEYILVDDGSTDDTAAIVEAFARRDGRLRLLRRPHAGGPYLAALDGLAQARGRLVLRTDADDLSLPHRVARQVAFLRDNPGLRACAAFCQLLDDAGPVAGQHYTAPLSSGVLRWYLCLRCPLVHSSACVEREALLASYRDTGAGARYLAWGGGAAGAPVVPDVEDYRMWCNLARPGWLGVIPESLVLFRRHQGRVSVLRAQEQQALAREVAAEHLAALGAGAWGDAALRALYAAGYSEPHPIEAGLAALARWDALWAADRTLAPAERAELRRLSAFRRRKFLRANARRQPAGFVRRLPAFCFPRPAPSQS